MIWLLVRTTMLAIATATLAFREDVPAFARAFAVAGLAAVGVVEAVRGIREELTARRRHRIEHEVLRPLLVGVLQVYEGVVGSEEIAVLAFTVRGSGRRERQVSIGRLRLLDAPEPSTIRWIRGKGAIGLAWESMRLEVVDYRPLCALPASKKAAIAKKGSKWSLTADESHQVWSRGSSVVMAQPVLLRDRVRGSIVVDIRDERVVIPTDVRRLPIELRQHLASAAQKLVSIRQFHPN